jgi:thiol-disulfide isomerase/thioredoxin
MRKPLIPSILVTMCLALAGAAFAADVKPIAIGSPAPDFNLPGVDGKQHALGEYKDAKILAVVFTCNHCPTAQAYEQRLIDLTNDYRDKGVAVVAINPNDAKAVRLDELGYTDLGDSLEDMKIRAAERKFPFPYLYDGDTQSVSRAYGVLATPHVFIFDADRKLRYQGRIDDSDVREVKSHDMRNAIDALLAGKPVPVEKTNVFGCSTKWSDKRDDAKKSLAKWDAEDVAIDTIDAGGVKKLAANAEGGKLLLVNVWATWCGPCVAEMPELVTVNRMYRKRPFEMITISMDEPEAKDAALKVLKDNHVSATNHLFTGDKDALVAALDPDGWQGPVPHTLLIAPGGKVIYRESGAVDAMKLKRAIVEQIGRTYASTPEKAHPKNAR